MDILNEEEAMFESPLLDSYLTSPVTVSVCVSSSCLLLNTLVQEPVFFMAFFLAAAWTVLHPAGCKSIVAERLRARVCFLL